MPDMIKIKSLTKCYGKHTAVNRVDMLVIINAIYGLSRENDAGKTTILQMIENLAKPGIYLEMSAIKNLKINISFIMLIGCNIMNLVYLFINN